jgi:hypothetical protein
MHILEFPRARVAIDPKIIVLVFPEPEGPIIKLDLKAISLVVARRPPTKLIPLFQMEVTLRIDTNSAEYPVLSGFLNIPIIQLGTPSIIPVIHPVIKLSNILMTFTMMHDLLKQKR